MPKRTRNGDSPEPPPPPPSAAQAHLDDARFGPALRRIAAAARSDRALTPSRPDGATQDLGWATEAELLGLMAAQSDDPGAARNAWGETYSRHARYLFHVVAQRYSHLLDADGISDIVADTLQVAFDWAGRQPSPTQVQARFAASDPDRVRRRTLGWLSVIARRLATHRIANRTEVHVQLREAMSSTDDGQDPPPARLRPLLANALAKLNEDELEALRVSLPWYEPETGEFAFPRGEAATTASSLGLTAGALRQRRHRSLRRLKSLLSDADK